MQVPDCFLEIASLTLQEFFRAVSAGKDSDPSWKKPIYKIIPKQPLGVAGRFEYLWDVTVQF